MVKHDLPTFKYHPDLIATGSIEASRNACACCGQARGYIYTGPCYGEEDYSDAICPWCIADGSAYEKLGVEFHDEASIPGSSFPDAPEVGAKIIQEVTQRTPGYAAWQQEEWFTCCNDAAAFLGRAGRRELESDFPDAIDALRQTYSLLGDDWDKMYESLQRDGSPTAYVFKCIHCGKYGAYWDCD